MWYGFAADVVVLLHLGFIAFVVAGGALVLRWRAIVWVHVPAALWGAYVELANRVCPLTPLENWLRIRAGQQGYSGGFIERYVIPIVYPDGLDRDTQVVLGVLVVVVNVLVYGLVAYGRRQQQSASNP